VPITKDAYSRSQTLDARLAMAVTLKRLLLTQVFPGPAGPIQFSEVFEEWPAWMDEFTNVAATIMPQGGPRYVDALPTPALIEDTWETAGEPGFGLYKLSEIECSFQLQIRATTVGERAALVAGMEALFVPDAVTSDHAIGSRYGLLLTMPEYWNLPARFALQSGDIPDDEDAAFRDRREHTFTVTAQTQHVKLGPVQPFIVTIVVDPDMPPP
jgi:hypothetical protein